MGHEDVPSQGAGMNNLKFALTLDLGTRCKTVSGSCGCRLDLGKKRAVTDPITLRRGAVRDNLLRKLMFQNGLPELRLKSRNRLEKGVVVTDQRSL